MYQKHYILMQTLQQEEAMEILNGTMFNGMVIQEEK